MTAGGFIALTVLQLSGQFDDCNRWLYEALAPLREESASLPDVHRLALLLTRLGDTWFCTGVSVLVLIWAGARRRSRIGLAFVLLMMAIGALNSLLKIALVVPRPALGQSMPTLSFPSGHASGAAALWGMLAVIFAASARSRLSATLVYGVAGLLILTVAISRVLIGVHWPLDVAAGLLEGLVPAFCLYALSRRESARQPVPDGVDALSLLLPLSGFTVLYILLNGPYKLY